MTACPSYVAPVVVDAGVDAPVEAAVDAGTPDAADAAADVASDVAVDAPVEAAVDAGVDAPVEAAVDAGTPDAAVDAPVEAAADAAVDSATDAAVTPDAPPAIGQRCLHYKPNALYTGTLTGVQFHYWFTTFPFNIDTCTARVDPVTGDYVCSFVFLTGTGMTISMEADNKTWPLTVCDDPGRMCSGKGDNCITVAQREAQLWATDGYCESPGKVTTSTWDHAATLSSRLCDGNLDLQF